MSCQAPKLQTNIQKSIEREGKIPDLMHMWYNSIVQTDPPPITDQTVLSYNGKVSYYYTTDTTNKPNVLASVREGLSTVLQGVSGVEIDSSAITDLVTSALADTTGGQTSQGYSTYVSESFKGKFRGIDCVYKPVVVALSFNFSAEEYGTEADVVAYGYWVYLLCVAVPSLGFTLDNFLTAADGKPYKIPPDKKVIGRRYMTKTELDAHQPSRM